MKKHEKDIVSAECRCRNHYSTATGLPDEKKHTTR